MKPFVPLFGMVSILLAACQKNTPENATDDNPVVPVQVVKASGHNGVSTKKDEDGSTTKPPVDPCKGQDGQPLPSVSNPCMVEANSERARAQGCLFKADDQPDIDWQRQNCTDDEFADME